MSPRSLISGRVRFPVAPAKSVLIMSASQDKATRGRKGQQLFKNLMAERTGSCDLAVGDVRSDHHKRFAQHQGGNGGAIVAAIIIGPFTCQTIAKPLIKCLCRHVVGGNF